MNQRIQELAEQAKASVPAGLVVSEWIETYNRLYADLIIRECMSNLYLNGYDDAMLQLQRHFEIGQC